MEEIIPAFSSGIISTIICNPLDVIRVNYQLKNKISIPPDIFYRGLRWGIITIPSFWCIYFPLHKKNKEYLPTYLSAYISSCVASTVTAPLWYIRQRIQTDNTHNWNTPLNFYYRGLKHTYLTNLNFIIQIPTYEFLKEKIGNNTFNIFLITTF